MTDDERTAMDELMAACDTFGNELTFHYISKGPMPIKLMAARHLARRAVHNASRLTVASGEPLKCEECGADCGPEAPILCAECLSDGIHGEGRDTEPVEQSAQARREESDLQDWKDNRDGL